eukprot:4236373-Pyramimonas_sp.AAC.1
MPDGDITIGRAQPFFVHAPSDTAWLNGNQDVCTDTGREFTPLVITDAGQPIGTQHLITDAGRKKGTHHLISDAGREGTQHLITEDGQTRRDCTQPTSTDAGRECTLPVLNTDAGYTHVNTDTGDSVITDAGVSSQGVVSEIRREPEGPPEQKRARYLPPARSAPRSPSPEP